MPGDIATTGNMFRDPNDTSKSARCGSCGAFGPVELCEKHYKTFMSAVDYWTRGAFTKFVSEHLESIKQQDAEVEVKRKQEQIEQLQSQIANLNAQKEALKNG